MRWSPTLLWLAVVCWPAAVVWTLETRNVSHPIRGSHARASRFRPAPVLRHGCDGTQLEFADTCDYDGSRWSSNDDAFQIVPAERFQHAPIRARIDSFEAIMLAQPQYVDISFYDAYYTWGDVLSVPGPSAYEKVPGKDFNVRLSKVINDTERNYLSRTLNHTYAFSGEYYLTAALQNRTSRDIERVSVTKITVVDEAHLCRPRLQVDGLGPCGRPLPVSAQRPALMWVRSGVSGHCSRPLVARTGVQFVVLYGRDQGQAPVVQCSGSTGPLESCAPGNSPPDCTYKVTVDKSCLRQGETAKVVLRQMWRGKTDVLIEAVAVGYLTASSSALHASIDGAPLVALSDVETLVLNGSGSRHLEKPGQALAFSWSCDQCDKNESLYQAFIKKQPDQEVIEVTDELQYGSTQILNFVLRVSSDSDNDSATIRVRVPGDQDDMMALSCPCCEFGVLSSEDLVVEARPQRTKLWNTSYPLVTWQIRGPTAQDAGVHHVPPGCIVEQRGAVLLMPAGYITRSGPHNIKASAWNQRPQAEVHFVLTHELFEGQGLREQSNLPPTKGHCQVNPKKGVAVKTIFHVGCTGFADPEGGSLSYGFYFCSHAPNRLKDVEGRRPKPWHSCTHIKSSLDNGTFAGVLPAGNSTAATTDCSVVVVVNDNVGQYVYDLLAVTMEIGSCSDITLETVDDYARQSQQNSPDAILSYIKSSAMLFNSEFYKRCNRPGSTTGTTNLSRDADVFDDYIGYLKNSPLTTENELHNAISVLQLLIPDNNSATTKNFTDAVIELMADYASAFSKLTSIESNWRIADLTATIGRELIDGLAALLDLKAPTPQELPVEVPGDFHPDSECGTVAKLVRSVARVAAGVSRVVDTEQNDAKINARHYEVWIRESQRRGFLGTSGGSRVRVEGSVDAQTAIVFPSNPFRCHETAKLINTQVVGVEAARGPAETPSSVRVPTESYLKRPTPLDWDGHAGTYETSFSNVSMHVINVTEAGVFLKIDVFTFDAQTRFITAVVSGRRPSRLDFLEQNRFHLASNVPHENRIEFVQKPALVTVAVIPLTNSSKARLLDPYRRRGDENGSATYTMKSHFYSCLFWNNTEQAYSSSGCRVLADSDEQFVHCACEHNSIFAGGLFIAPHPIDFTDLGSLLLTMSRNIVMAVIISAVWLVYLLVMVWAAKQDALDEGAAGIEYLTENEQDDAFGYLVSVYTWFLKGSGTTSRVLLVVHGSDDESREVVLRDGARNPLALQAGGRDWYFLSHPSSLGDVEAISLTLELKGYASSWYLSTVVVRDLQTASQVVFIVDDVLTPDAYKGASTFTFHVADEGSLRNPWRIFTARIIRYFREEHLIFSIFSRLPTSNFTRKQRASLALLLVTTGMMVSLMFYGLDADEEEYFNWRFLYTLLELPTRRELVIALQSTILVTPFAFLVVFLLEKSRPLAFRRKPTVPKVYVEDVVEDWVHDTDTSTGSAKMGQVPRERLTSSVQLPLFPTWVSVFAWLLCLSASLVASVLVILYGLTYGYRRSLSWVRCNFINIFLGEFVVSPLKILCLSAIMACVLKAPVEMENIPVRFIE
ncbi:polycystin-1-like isoform X1 [Dermacentor albipictus]|uniref:polycystin-1-like isoform X1 n=1 Tax=Dermacentor albipictus TaxID=60249 RepID=UPI0031FE284A